MSSPRSPRRQLKVGPSNAPVTDCPEGYYRWRNYFASGCKPKAEDRRSLGLGGKIGSQVLWNRVRGGASPRSIQADGMYDAAEARAVIPQYAVRSRLHKFRAPGINWNEYEPTGGMRREQYENLPENVQRTFFG
jgi:hypothetical protein